MVKHTIILLALSSIVNAECILQETTISKSSLTVSNHDNITRNITTFGDQFKCSVRYRALVGNEWHTATGDFVFHDMLPSTACANAIALGDSHLLESLSQKQIQKEQMLVCHDDNKIMASVINTIGDQVKISQLTPDPNRPKSFAYNGTECKWFLDRNFIDKKLLTGYGIACKLTSDDWVIVDKF